ncbi:hypothetical protein M0R72_01170 [Candidatus Pacearchaeota archaeon]|jgi:hypothetical protein|nr:hypothetical protein [Candidatus Pacearchaeota archaeon]
MTDKSEMPVAASIIVQYLQHLSQEHYCAKWTADIEHSIWEHVIGPDPAPEEDGRFWNRIGNDLVQLRKLAAECKGWVCFNDLATGPDDFRSFVPIEEWIKQHAAHTGKEMTEEQRHRLNAFMNERLSDKQRKLQDHAAAVVLAIQASGRTDVHLDFLEVLRMIPLELRGCPDCGTHPGGVHHPKCKSLTYEKVRSETVYDDAFIEKVPWR